MRVLLLFYNLLFPVVFLAMLPGFAMRMIRRGNYRHKFGQRLGIYSRRVREKLRADRWTWIHAVSVGEVLIALKLIAALREKSEKLPIVLSTTTSTGYRLAHRHRSALLEPIYHPLDLPIVTKKAFDLIRPHRIILVEAEVWPNQMARASAQQIPRFLVNARLSPRSFGRYRLVRPLASALFNSLDKLCIQDPVDTPRWEALGVRPDRIAVTGSIKFDQASGNARHEDFRPFLRSLGVPDDAPILLAGSTFDGEEELLAGVAGELRARFPSLYLVLVPRHAERGESVRTQLRRAGHRVALRTEDPVPGSDLLVVNTTGELRSWYHCATVVFIGKSLATRASGGQNPAEPIAAGKPVIFGPSMQNFRVLVDQLLREGGAAQVRTRQDLIDTVSALLDNPARAEHMVREAHQCLHVHAGATARTADIVLSDTSG